MGHPGVDENLIRQTVERLQQPNTYWLDLGDACECINIKDKRFDITNTPDWIEKNDIPSLVPIQIERYVDFFKPVASTCLARLTGNHERSFLQQWGVGDVYQQINKGLGIPDERALGFSGFVILRIQRQVSTREMAASSWTNIIYLAHGNTAGQLAGAKALNLERMSGHWHAHIYCVGHSHTKLILPGVRQEVRPGQTLPEERDIAGINVGAFFHGGVNDYTEEKGLYPQRVGPVTVLFNAHQRRFQVLDGLEWA